METVKSMKTDLSKLDSKIMTLESSMENITNLVLKVESQIQVKRNEIQKLDTINKDLSKLKYLCDLP